MLVTKLYLLAIKHKIVLKPRRKICGVIFFFLTIIIFQNGCHSDRYRKQKAIIEFVIGNATNRSLVNVYGKAALIVRRYISKVNGHPWMIEETDFNDRPATVVAIVNKENAKLINTLSLQLKKNHYCKTMWKPSGEPSTLAQSIGQSKVCVM